MHDITYETETKKLLKINAMRSQIATRIMSKTSKETKDFVKKYSKQKINEAKSRRYTTTQIRIELRWLLKSKEYVNFNENQCRDMIRHLLNLDRARIIIAALMLTPQYDRLGNTMKKEINKFLTSF